MKSRVAAVVGSVLIAFLAFDFAGSAPAQDSQNPAEPQDPPGRVGRLSFIEGGVQQRSAGDADFTGASLNYPVTNGFALATQEGGRAEIQLGSMAVRIGSDSELDVNAIGDHTTTLTLARGEINLRLAQLAEGDQVQIVTPRGVANIVSAGYYHFDAGSTERPTQAAVFSGRVEVARDGGPTILTNGQAALINSDEASGLTLAASSRDPLDDWAVSRDRRTSQTAASRTVSPEMTGGGDLGQYGTWRQDPRYGDVWRPTDVPANWAPYRYGRWAWEPPWGWTWIDDAPWGFAPFHYGRWVYTAYGWEWVPGGYANYPVYAPALVGWVGFGPSVGWFPLAPFEVFVPSFFVSIDFVRRINITNVNITNINIIRANGNVVVNNTTNVTINNFANRQFITSVSTTSFASGQSVSRTMLAQSSTTHVASTTPVSWAPTNVTAPHAAVATNGGPRVDAAVRPPVPTTNGGSMAAGKTGGGTGAVASATPESGPQPGNGHHGSTDSTANSVTAAGHRLPPLPSERPHTSSSTAANTAAASHPASPLASPRQTHSGGSLPMASANRGRAPHGPTVTPSMHAPAFAPTRVPTMGTMMPRGPSTSAAPRPTSPPMHSMGFMQHRGG